MAVVSLGTAVGWIVSPMIKIMIGKTQSYVSAQYKWSSDMIVDLTNLEDNLTQILLVVGVAERRKIVDPNQAMLLRRIKSVVYEAEDVMDEFDYMLMKEKVEKQKMLSHLASSSLSFGKRLVGLDEFRPKLKKVIDKLNRVKASAEVFLHVMGTENDTSSIRQTQISKMRVTNSVSHEVVIGRDEERDKLIEMLLMLGDEPDQNNMYHPKVSSVVGDGGMGKTTLIQTVYNNEQIKCNFDLRIWVCVSENFEKSKLAEEILVAVTDNKDIKLRNYSYDLVQIEIKRVLDTKKFLLVLDDVWYNENVGKELYKDIWKELFAIFKNKERGCKILVTTRMKIVGELLGSTEFALSGLKPEYGWSLFSKYAFGGEKLEDHPDLQDIGKQIVENLGGSALAIKVIGGQLNANFGFEEWNRILKKDLSKPSDIMTILRLSYEHLPEHLQRCFAYCGLFPKDWNLDSGKIIDMWIAQGFVHLEESDYTSDLENVGKDYFKELLSRSFLEQLERGDKIYYVMHDLMNDLALHVSEGECFRIEHEEFKLPSSIRHLSIANKKLDKLSFAKELEGLRTLIIFENSVLCSKVILEGYMLEKFKSVRVLDLSGCCLDRIPNTIDRMVHLRYLALKRTGHPLPRSVYKLYHLQVLAILYHSCQNLGPFQFCKSIKDLIGLLHVDVAGAYAVILDGMHNLSCLRADGVLHVKKKRWSKLVELKDNIKCVNGIFHAENKSCKKLDDFKGKKKHASTEQSFSRLGELNDKNKLRGKLSIKSLENVKSLTEAIEARLDCKEDITELELEYQWKEKPDMFKEQIDVLNALQPHRNLQKLVIKGSLGTKSPSWLETDWLNRVQIINLCNCYYWKSLPPFGQLPLLNDLKVAKNDSITQISTEFYGTGVFPSLARLCFEDLSELQGWLGFDGRQLFPKLQQLLISRCNKLIKIPHLPVGLEYFSIGRSKPSVSIYRADYHLDFLHYVNDRSVPLRPLFGFKASSLVFLDFLHAHHLNSFQVLDIDFQSNISMIGRMLQLIKSQKFLKELSIREVNSECIELILAEHKDKWDNALPMSLHTLDISHCEFTVGMISIWLQKLSSLNKLILYHCFGTYQGQTFTLPSFVMLESIDIRSAEPFISLPDLKNYPNLEKLVLSNFEAPENTLTDSDSMQKLKVLTIHYCHNLEILSNVNGCPSQLEKLSIFDCRALKTLDNVGNSIRMRRLSLTSCDQITTLEGLQGLVSLSQMYIFNCPQLLSLPKMDRFYSLEIIIVYNCPNLNSLPKKGLPVSLGKLYLEECHPMMHEQFKKKKGREWNKVAAILLKGRCYYTVGDDKLKVVTRDLYEPEQEQQERRRFTLKNCITFS